MEVLGCGLHHEAEVLSLDLWFGLVFCLELSKFQGRGLVETFVFLTLFDIRPNVMTTTVMPCFEKLLNYHWVF